MSDDIKEIVKEKYARGGAPRDRGRGRVLLRLGVLVAGSATRSPRTSTRDGDGRAAGRGQSPPRSAAATRRPWPSSSPVRRCSISARAAASTCCCRRRPRGTDGQGLRPRHDRRDAGPRAREPAEGRRRPTSSSSRARSRRSRCPDNSVDVDHLQLRDQSVGRQGPRARRGVPRPEAGRAPRGVGRGRARRGARRDPAERGAVDRVRGRRAGGERVPGEARRGGLRGNRASSRPGSIGWRTRGTSWPEPGSTSIASRPRWTASS